MLTAKDIYISTLLLLFLYFPSYRLLTIAALPIKKYAKKGSDAPYNTCLEQGLLTVASDPFEKSLSY